MPQELRRLQSGKSDDNRLSIRVMIALGDVLHQDRDIFGDTVNFTATIESITPQNEIYCSQAAWLALNKAEVQTSFVNEFSWKGSVVIFQCIKNEVIGTIWENKIKKIEQVVTSNKI